MLLYPGQKGELVLLQDCLRQVHDEQRAARAKEIEERRRYNVPLDDSTDWVEAGKRLAALEEAVGERSPQKVREALPAVHAHLAGGALEELGEYVDDDDLEGIRVRFAVMSDADRRDLMAQMADHWVAIDKARLRGATVVEVRALDEEILKLQETWLGLSVAEVVVDDVALNVVESMPGLRRSGLLAPLFRASRAFQDMPAKKAWRFGLPSPSTSTSSATAVGAQSLSVGRSAATVTPAPLTPAGPNSSPAHLTPPTVARGVTSSTTPI